jgi:hypothetical protein
MKRATISAGVFVAVLVGILAPSRAVPSATAFGGDSHQGFLYGRVTTDAGGAYVGRLRFGRDEEAFWGDYFNGVKREDRWAAHSQVPAPTQKPRTFAIFGFEFPFGESEGALVRPFMTRFGDIARIEAPSIRIVRVTLKSGTVFNLNRNAASDFDDGLRVWDESRGVVDLASWAGGIPPPARVRIRSIELLPTARLAAAPGRLHATVRTTHGEFTGFVQWDRQASVGTDELAGRAAEGPLRLRFDTIRAIARRPGGALVTLLDGREIVLSGTRAVGEGFRGIYVDDPRYGRVLVSWDAFERIHFSAAGSGPAYNDFPQGRALMGTVTTRDGRRLTGRLVYDLDESETTETLDAPYLGVDYTVPFGLIASIRLAGSEQRTAGRATVTLHGGEILSLDRVGDLGERNAGMLIFVDGRERAEFVRWSDVEQMQFDLPSVMYPPLRVTSTRHWRQR